MNPRQRAVRKVMAIKATFHRGACCGHSRALHQWGSKLQCMKTECLEKCEGWNGA